MFPPNPTSPEDEGRFLTPSLRGVALTAPYGHAGTLPTLEAVIDLYAVGGAPSGDPNARGERDVFAEPFSLNQIPSPKIYSQTTSYILGHFLRMFDVFAIKSMQVKVIIVKYLVG